MAWTKDEMCRRAAELELFDGVSVNLGIGIPTNVANYIPEGMLVLFQSENGMLGMGPFPYEGDEDPDLINAGKQTITELPYSSYFSSDESFAMIRGSHIDLTILGALQVSGSGDLANWTIPGKMLKGMGGAMDLVANTKRVVIIMDHVAKDGSSKLVANCDLPLTGVRCVDRIYTELGVFDIDKKSSSVKIFELAPEVTIEEVKSKTLAKVIS